MAGTPTIYLMNGIQAPAKAAANTGMFGVAICSGIRDLEQFGETIVKAQVMAKMSLNVWKSLLAASSCKRSGLLNMEELAGCIFVKAQVMAKMSLNVWKSLLAASSSKLRSWPRCP